MPMRNANRGDLAGLHLALEVAKIEALHPEEDNLPVLLQRLINEAELSPVGCDAASELRYIANQLREAGATVPPAPLGNDPESAIAFGMSTALGLIEKRLAELD
jgi:hypothetical protein